MVALIIGCEIAFWVVLIAGLLARYVFRAPRLGIGLLAAVPAVDLVLLVVSTVDLARGATATWAHGLAAVYLGFSVAYGTEMVRWADRWAAFLAGRGPRPLKRYGREHSRWALKDLGRAVLAGAIAVVLLQLAIWFVGDAGRTAALSGWFGSVGLIVAIVAVIDLSDVFWPRKPRAVRP